ncbi:glycosyltransferase family 2 protein [Patescibacteria group bacterium]|nr:glycosyltransferase family 2 protein [Patescibacteria group bacterium]MBU1922499.1 glycosyltransferase family 2 protein [Patescibacteria group bacterium]
MAQISINIVTWNGMRFLPDALKSILGQTHQDFKIIVVDNGSTDGTVEYVRTNLPKITLLRNVRNLGFARGHNQGFHLALDKWPTEERDKCFVLIANQDLILEPDFLEKITRFARANTRGAIFGGKLLRAYFKPEDEEFEEKIKSDVLDSTGLVMKKSRRVIDRGAGEQDSGQYDEKSEVFGISGALALIRASALDDIRYKDEYFDEDFFSYKEDIDLGWRMRLRGWQSYYVPQARAFHFRGAYSPTKASASEKIRLRRQRPFFIKVHSFSNHYLALLKTGFIRHMVVDFPLIFLYELKKCAYSFFFEPRVFWRGVADFLKKLGPILQKRKYIFSRIMIKPKELRKWFE